MLLGYSLWLATLGLQTWLLIHLLRVGLASRYPFFFGYLAVSWVNGGLLWFAHHNWSPLAYSWAYWSGEFVTVLVGFLLVGEVFRETFRPFAEIRRSVTWLVLILILLVLAASLFLQISGLVQHSWQQLFAQLPRWLRLVQALLLATLVGVTRYYYLPLGRNMIGLAAGFGLYTSLAVVGLVFQGLGLVDLPEFGQLYAVAYIVALGTWSYSLRVYAPNPVPVYRGRLEQDFAHVNAVVSSTLGEIRGSLRKALGT